jgi:ABC-type nickel/cobalt efflux system permease component RcnA
MNLIESIEQGAANPMSLITVAFILGAMHGLEPGHSKTIMAARMTHCFLCPILD